MKNKLLILVAVFLFASAFTIKPTLSKKVQKITTVEIGLFSVSGQFYHAYGDGLGHVSAVYISDINATDISLVYSWSGTYVVNTINVNFKRTSTSPTLNFTGTCSI